MIGLLWVAEAVLLGNLLAGRFTNWRAVQPPWARRSLQWGAGAAAGIGLTSCLYTLLGVLLGIPLLAMVLELALLAWLGFDLFRRAISRRHQPRAAHRCRFQLP